MQRLADAVSRAGDDWRAASIAAGRILLAGLPDLEGVTRLLVVPDGPLHFVPFEALTVPGAARSARRAVRDQLSAVGGVARPPQRAAGSPRGSGHGSASWWPSAIRRRRRRLRLPEAALPRLSHADEEIRGIAASLPGRAELHLGADAQKRFLHQDLRGVPLLHFSTHAIADTRDPDRSRILLAPAAAGGPADHLFLREIYDLDLSGVQLVTLSACDTERGKVIRGEGVEGFSRALLAAGAASAVTTMWDVVDRASAEFMKQFYFALARGESEASALRQAKLQFLRSPLAVVASALLGRIRAERRRPRTAPARGAVERVVGALSLSALAVATGAYRSSRGVRRDSAESRAGRSARRFGRQPGRDRPRPLVTEQTEHLRSAPTRPRARTRRAAAPHRRTARTIRAPADSPLCERTRRRNERACRRRHTTRWSRWRRRDWDSEAPAPRTATRFMAGYRAQRRPATALVPEKIGCVVESSVRPLVAAGMPRMYE